MKRMSILLSIENMRVRSLPTEPRLYTLSHIPRLSMQTQCLSDEQFLTLIPIHFISFRFAIPISICTRSETQPNAAHFPSLAINHRCYTSLYFQDKQKTAPSAGTLNAPLQDSKGRNSASRDRFSPSASKEFVMWRPSGHDRK
jgi:hypothetical protein